MNTVPALSSAASAIVRVGDGRGFLVEGQGRLSRMVVTAAHCLPHLPPPTPASFTFERSYSNLLGPLGVEPTIMAECLFVDPIADVAVLGQPDNQVFTDEADAYEVFVASRSIVRIGVLTAPGTAYLHTLDGRWEPCSVQPGNPFHPARTLTLVEARDGNMPGTSGSPIMSADGRVLAVVSIGSETVTGDGERILDREQWGQPLLASTLPLWLLSNLGVDIRKARTACRQWVAAVRDVVRKLDAKYPVTGPKSV